MQTKEGFVYKLVAFETDKVYVGSTVQGLRNRLYEHRRRFKSMGGDCSSREILKFKTNNIMLLETIPDTGRQFINLRQREDYWIRHFGDKAVNQQRAVANKEEYLEQTRERRQRYNKTYRQNHLEERIRKDKAYYENNREKILEQKKDYNRNNKEKIKEKNKNYYQNNKEKFVWTEEKLERRRELYQQNKDAINERKRARLKFQRTTFGEMCKLYGVLNQ